MDKRDDQSMCNQAKPVVLSFWKSMGGNDFYAASQFLSDDYEGAWPQSSALIRGRDNFSALNTAYPSKGKWRFTVNSIITEGSQVVTDVSVSGDEQKARAIRFNTIENNQIHRQAGYWPESYSAPKWRTEWVEKNPP